MSADLKQSLDQDLSILVREYQDSGLSPEEIRESLDMYAEIARTRGSGQSDDDVVIGDQ